MSKILRPIRLTDIYQYGSRERVTRSRLLSSETPCIENIGYVKEYMDKNDIGYVVADIFAKNDVLQGDGKANHRLPLSLCKGEMVATLKHASTDAAYPSLPGFSSYTIPGRTCHMLFTQGNQALLKQPILGVVGPRKMSAYGKRVIDALIQVAQQFSCAIISGGAVGVDRYVHEQAMRVGIPVIVVLGGGVAAYHASTARGFLQQVVASGGLILSEFQLREEPQKHTFPLRNRIIAGLSHVLFVPEAGEKSGSLITVDYAIDAGVPVYTATHDIFAHTSRGMSTYLQSGSVNPVVDLEQMMVAHFTRAQSFAPKNISVYSSVDSTYVQLPGSEEREGYASVADYLVADMLRQLQ